MSIFATGAPKWLLAAALAACTLVACTLTACTLTEGGAPKVDAPLLKTGNAKYDDFFNSVVDVRDEARKAPVEADRGHGDLMRVLGLDANAKGTVAIDAVGDRAKKLHDKGVLLHLEIAPEPKVIAVRGKVVLGADSEALFKAMEGTLRTSLETRKRLGVLASRTQELEKRRAELRDQVADAFKDESPARRDDIVAQLDLVKAIIAAASDNASRAAGAESRFVVDLVYAAETGGGAHPEASTAAARGAPVARGGRGAPVARGGAPANPPAAPPPKKKPKGAGDDFEP